MVGFGFDDVFEGFLSKMILQHPFIGKILYVLSLYGDNFIYDVFMGGSVFSLATSLIHGDPVIKTSPYTLYPDVKW